MNKKSTSSIDQIIGARIRLRRLTVGMSQEKLGHLLGITFQQIQKYEKGLNRVTASRLVEIANALDVSVHFFFDSAEPQVDALFLFNDTEVRQLIRLYSSLPYEAKAVVQQLCAGVSHLTEYRDGWVNRQPDREARDRA